MNGWEGLVLAISSIVIALGMIIMIIAFILVFIALRKLIKGISKMVHYLTFDESDPVDALTDTFQKIFEERSKTGKLAAALKCGFLGYFLWQKVTQRRERRER